MIIKVTTEVFPTPTGGAASQIPPETASPQPEASAAAPDTERETDINSSAAKASQRTEAPPLLRAAATHRSQVQSLAEVDLVQQQQQAAPHIQWFEKQAADGLGGAALAQEVQRCEEGLILLGQMVVRHQTFSA